jgi:hypothetical protein
MRRLRFWSPRRSRPRIQGEPTGFDAAPSRLFVNILTLSLVFLFGGRGFRKLMESSLDVESCFSCSVFVAFFRSRRSPPSPLSSSTASLRGVVRRRSSKRRKNGRRSPVGMPARVLWVRGVAVPLWPDHSPVKSRDQLAPFPACGPGAGHGGGSIGTRHDFASACRWRCLERARRQFRRSRHPGTLTLDCRLHDRRSKLGLMSEAVASPSSNSSVMPARRMGKRVARMRAR